MMSAYANSLQKPEGFDKYVRKFRSICTMHGVQIGSRTKLPDFMRKLGDDRHLAMDFWAFIGKLSDREGGELSDDQMLGVVVEGITEGEISEEDGGQMRTVDDLRAMLAGVDIKSPEQTPVAMAPFPRSEAGSQRNEEPLEKPGTRAEEQPANRAAEQLKRAAEQLWTRAEESATKPSDSPAPFSGERFNGNVNHAAVLPTPPPPPQLDEALLRLELTKLVQQYFDNVDKRISKLEPNAEGEASMGTIAPAVTRRSLEEPISAEEMEELRLRRVSRTRLVLESAPAPVEEPLRASRDDDDIPMRVPLEHYSPAEYGKAPLLLVLVLIGAAFAIYRDPTLLRRGYAAGVSQLHNFGSMMSSHRSTSQPASSNQAAPTTTEQSQPSAGQSAFEGTSSPPPVNRPEQTSSGRSQSAENGSNSSNGRRSTTDRVLGQVEAALTDGSSSIETAGAVKVNPSVMDENLIVQRVPAYPEGAKISGVEGDVVMQALISKEGTVKRVHVVAGDSRLRSAAEEAVYKWRYRPYVLNGQPVEVATTVTVNFNLDR
jgi:TonB family protein